MSVTAHGSPYSASQHPEKMGIGLTKIECTDNGHDTIATLNKACKTQQDKPLECESMHCSFHYIFLDQSSANYIHGLGQDHTKRAENPLTALSPKSAKKPPRQFS